MRRACVSAQPFHTCSERVDVNIQVAARVHGQDKQRGAARRVVQHPQHGAILLLQPRPGKHGLLSTDERKDRAPKAYALCVRASEGRQFGDERQRLLDRRVHPLSQHGTQGGDGGSLCTTRRLQFELVTAARSCQEFEHAVHCRILAPVGRHVLARSRRPREARRQRRDAGRKDDGGTAQ